MSSALSTLRRALVVLGLAIGCGAALFDSLIEPEAPIDAADPGDAPMSPLSMLLYLGLVGAAREVVFRKAPLQRRRRSIGLPVGPRARPRASGEAGGQPRGAGRRM